MKFQWLVALRYLRSPHRPAVLRLVTVLAVLGVCAGVTSLVVALAMNTGFREAIRDRLLSVTAHVNLKPIDSASGIENYRALASRLSSTPGVKSIEPALYNTVLLSFGGQSHGVMLKGVDPELERKASSAWDHLTAGSSNFSEASDGVPGIMIGRLLAADLGMTPISASAFAAWASISNQIRNLVSGDQIAVISGRE